MNVTLLLVLSGALVAVVGLLVLIEWYDEAFTIGAAILALGVCGILLGLVTPRGPR